MPTKYTLESEVEKALEARRAPYTRAPVNPYASFRPRSYRTMLLFLLVLMCALLIFSRARANPYAGQPWLRGEGTLVEKLTLQEPPVYAFEIALDSGLATRHEVTKDHWDNLQTGDRVGLLYRISRDGKKLQIQECSLLALPRNIQLH